MISKDLKRLGYESSPRGPVPELSNRGPSDGLGIISKSNKNTKGSRRKRENSDVIPEGEEETEDGIENMGSQMSVQRE